jgi:hypothetical protein
LDICTTCKAILLNTFHDSLWVPSLLVISEVGTHKEFRNVVNKHSSHIVQNSKTRKECSFHGESIKPRSISSSFKWLNFRKKNIFYATTPRYCIFRSRRFERIYHLRNIRKRLFSYCISSSKNDFLKSPL